HGVWVPPRRYLLDHHVGKLEIESPRRDRRDLRKRGVLHDRDRAVGRLAAMTFHELPHTTLVDSEQDGEQANRAIDVFRVLADDRDAVGVPVLDEHAALAVEQQAARSAEPE